MTSFEWFQIVPLHSENALGLRGAEAVKSDARYLFRVGNRLPDGFISRFKFTVAGKRVRSDLVPNNLGWLIVSENARQALQTVPDLRVEWIRIPFPPLEQSYGSLWLLHPLVTAPVLDEQRSTLTWTTVNGVRYISAIQRLVLQEEEVRNYTSSIITVQQYSSAIVVRSDFAESWKRNSCRGIHFELCT